MDAMSHGKGGADFRACREFVGWTQYEVSQNLDLNINTVKRWERPLGQYEPPTFAWEWMDAELAAHDAEVDRILDAVEGIEEQSGKTLDPVKLVLFHNNDGMGFMRPDHRSASWHNAVARDAWQCLTDSGHNVQFVWSMAKDNEAIW